MQQCEGFPRSLSTDLFLMPSFTSSVPSISTEIEMRPAVGISLIEGAWTHFVSSEVIKDPPEILSLQIQERLRENSGILLISFISFYSVSSIFLFETQRSAQMKSYMFLLM